MNFPHNGKSLAGFSAQWKNIVHAVERGALAPTHNTLQRHARIDCDQDAAKARKMRCGGDRWARARIFSHWSHGVAVGYQIGEKDDGDYIELLPEPFFYAPTWSKKGAVK